MVSAPSFHKEAYLELPFCMHSHLLLCHRYEEIFVHSLGHLEFHVFLATADEDVVEFFAYLVQVLVSQYFASFVGDDMVFLEDIVWGKTEIIDKFHDGV